MYVCMDLIRWSLDIMNIFFYSLSIWNWMKERWRQNNNNNNNNKWISRVKCWAHNTYDHLFNRYALCMQYDASIKRNETANTEKAALHTIYKIRFDLKYNKIFSFHNTKQSHEIIFLMKLLNTTMVCYLI